MNNDDPILIFRGDEKLCYGILLSFSEQLRDAFVSLGEEVVFFDARKDRIQDCFGRKYKAVIAFMENFFYNRLPDSETMLFDLIEGPKFNYWPDHPAFYYHYVENVPKDYYILTQDQNYVNFINKYYKGVSAFFLPPGGRKIVEDVPFEDRKYELTFLGTYVDYRDVLNGFNASDETTQLIINAYLDEMINNPEETTEDAFDIILKKLGANVSIDQFLNELCKIHRIATMGAARFYKEKVIKTLIENEIHIDVFGESWKKAPFSDSGFLTIHPEISAREVSDVYKQSKMSLNIMTWHKDSITERVLDAMMAGSIAISDRTGKLEEAFVDNKEIILYSLSNIEDLPQKIRANITNADMAHEGRKAAISCHCWTDRAKDLLRIIKEL